MAMQQSLIDAIVAEPEASGRWIVYADWLLERGDPRGELINLELAVENRRAEPSATARIHELVADEDALLSPRLAAQAHFWDFVFRRGFIHEAKLIGAADDPPTGEALEALFADPHAGLIDTLSLGGYRDIHHVLVQRVRRGVRFLTLANCDIDAFHQLPALEALEILYGPQGDAPVDAVEHRSLRSLTAPISERLAGRLNESLPALTTLTTNGRGFFERLAHDQLDELDCGSCVVLATPCLTTLECTLDRAAVAAPASFLQQPPPRLTRVSLHSDLEPAELAECLARSALVRQLRYLTLHCQDDTALVDEVVARAESFRSLGWLILGPRQITHPAFPSTRFSIPAEVEEPVFLTAPETDAESRRLEDGRIDAEAAFRRGR
jgi:uncharacterized protein (TIGR02996 family)